MLRKPANMWGFFDLLIEDNCMKIHKIFYGHIKNREV